MAPNHRPYVACCMLACEVRVNCQFEIASQHTTQTQRTNSRTRLQIYPLHRMDHQVTTSLASAGTRDTSDTKRPLGHVSARTSTNDSSSVDDTPWVRASLSLSVGRHRKQLQHRVHDAAPACLDCEAENGSVQLPPTTTPYIYRYAPPRSRYLLASAPAAVKRSQTRIPRHRHPLVLLASG